MGENGNLKIWDAYGKTDPKITKEVKKKGHKVTAIDAYQQIKQATELFGPMGKWGLRNVSIIVESEIAILTGEFFHPDGAFGVTNSMDLYTRPRNGSPYRDDEFAKKLMTDTITKALSYLGFNHDVFFGLFDDQRYVQERAAEENANQAPDWAAGVPEENVKIMKDIWNILDDQVTRGIITGDVADNQWGIAVQAKMNLTQVKTIKTNLTGRPS